MASNRAYSRYSLFAIRYSPFAIINHHPAARDVDHRGARAALAPGLCVRPGGGGAAGDRTYLPRARGGGGGPDARRRAPPARGPPPPSPPPPRGGGGGGRGGGGGGAPRLGGFGVC